MTDHPITPPEELVQQVKQWEENWHHSKSNIELELYMAARAAQWGADQELEACCKWLGTQWLGARTEGFPAELRAARRPKPPSLKEQALEAMREMQIEPCIINGVDMNAAVRAKYETIRRALEQLDD